MKFGLLDNGIDSLKMGIFFYDKYLGLMITQTNDGDFEKDSYLKLSVICIQNSVEILSKMVLSNFNELLIYKDIDSVINDSEAVLINSELSSLHEFLIQNDKNIKTIEYSLCIKRLKQLCKNKLDNNNAKDLEYIGYERNKLTHFGIAKVLDYHKSIGLIHRVINIIGNFFLSELHLDSDPKYYSLIQQIFEVKQLGELVEKTEWAKSTADQFQKIYNLLDICVQKLREDGIEIKIEYNTDQEGLFYLEIDNNDGSGKIIDTYVSPFLDTLFFVANDIDEQHILAIIDFNEANYLYECKIPNNFIYSETIDVKYWNVNPKDFIKRELNENQIDFILRKLLPINV